MNASKRPRQHALVIGIDKYPRMHANPLRGCVHDARRMAWILSDRFGFAAENVQLLIDEAATREAILAALGGLLSRVGVGDRVVVHFSGHGSQVEWRGGFVESIVPHDSGRYGHPNLDIADVEIIDWVEAIAKRTPYLTLIIDACHAASMVRSPGVRQAEVDRRPSAEQGRPAPPAWMTAKTRDARPSGLSGWLPWPDSYTLIAGCKSNERACELDTQQTGVPHGALTFFLAQELQRARPRGTWRDVFEPAALRVTAHFPHQHPQLEGAVDREIFERRDRPPMRFVPVQTAGEGFRLAAGAIHGVVPGSRWQVFPQGTTAVERQSSLGNLQVREVEAVESLAEAIYQPGPILSGSRAVEFERPWYAPGLVVRVLGEAERVTPMIQAFQHSPLLTVTDDPQHSGVTVVRRVGADQPLPEFEDLRKQVGTRPFWLVTDPTGEPIAPPRLAQDEATEGSEVHAAIRHDLELWARYRALASLRPEEGADALGDRIEVELFRLDGAGAWMPAPRPCTLFEGERVAFRIRHRHHVPLYVSVLDLGLSGAIEVLHPIRGVREALLPDQVLRFGFGHRDAITLHIPEALPFAGGTFGEGQEILKILATEAEADFDLLSQDAVRFGKIPDVRLSTPLTQLLGLMLTGKPERTYLTRQAEAGFRWTALERRIRVRRRPTERGSRADGLCE